MCVFLLVHVIMNVCVHTHTLAYSTGTGGTGVLVLVLEWYWYVYLYWPGTVCCLLPAACCLWWVVDQRSKIKVVCSTLHLRHCVTHATATFFFTIFDSYPGTFSIQTRLTRRWLLSPFGTSCYFCCRRKITITRITITRVEIVHNKLYACVYNN